MTLRQPLVLVGDMLDSARRIMRMAGGMSKADFLDDASEALRDAIAYRLVIIGEASASLLAKFPEFCAVHSEVPWKSARAMRNFIVHDYVSINQGRVWETIANSIPELIGLLEPLAE